MTLFCIRNVKSQPTAYNCIVSNVVGQLKPIYRKRHLEQIKLSKGATENANLQLQAVRKAGKTTRAAPNPSLCFSLAYHSPSQETFGISSALQFQHDGFWIERLLAKNMAVLQSTLLYNLENSSIKLIICT